MYLRKNGKSHSIREDKLEADDIREFLTFPPLTEAEFEHNLQEICSRICRLSNDLMNAEDEACEFEDKLERIKNML